LNPVDLIVPLAGMVTGVVISIGFFRTVRHFIDHKLARGDDSSVPAEIADLRARIETLEREHDRVDELEDRLDFAERLLARQQEAEAKHLPGAR
jgi:hypothetical protein